MQKQIDNGLKARDLTLQLGNRFKNIPSSGEALTGYIYIPGHTHVAVIHLDIATKERCQTIAHFYGVERRSPSPEPPFEAASAG